MLTAFLAMASIIGQATPPATSKALHAEYLALIQAERDELTSISDRLAKGGKEEGAAVARGLVEPKPPEGRTRFVPMPEVVPEIKPEDRIKLPDEVKSVRERTAKALFVLATKAASKTVRRISLADRCLRGVLTRDPNHAESRRLLGYLPYQGGWATPHAVGLLKTGYVSHPKFGWVPADWVKRLDNGKLPSEFDDAGKAKSWLPAKEANALHREWQFAWTISTAPHFRIESNVDLDEAIAFGQRLEVFYQFFLSEFGDLITADHHPLIKRFDTKKMKPTASSYRFQVSYFAAKSEYVDFMMRKFNRDESVSLGYYMPKKDASQFGTDPRSYFFKDDKNPIAAHSTLYHEGSHQILFEMAGKSKYDENATNYWIWEGLGTYFETVEPQEDGSLLAGGLIGPRIAEARVRILQRGEYIPLAKFTEMGETKFRDPAEQAVIRNYQQAMALAAFLLNGEDGAYREAFLDYVVGAYRGKVNRSSLSEKLRKPFPVLDEQFQKYLK